MGIKRNIDSGRKDSLGRKIKISGLRGLRASSSNKRSAADDARSVNSEIANSQGRNKVKERKKRMAKTVAIGMTAGLAVAMSGAQVANADDVTPDYAQVCVKKDTGERLPNEDCEPGSNESNNSNSAIAALVWMNMMQNNRTTYIPPVGYNITSSNTKLSRDTPRSSDRVFTPSNTGGHITASEVNKNDIFTGKNAKDMNTRLGESVHGKDGGVNKLRNEVSSKHNKSVDNIQKRAEKAVSKSKGKSNSQGKGKKSGGFGSSSKSGNGGKHSGG